jgi:hypothetical protein
MDSKDWKFWNREVFRTRGVSREVAEARGYIPYAKGDRWVSADDGPFAAIPKSQRSATIAKDVALVEGLVMTKHAIPGLGPVLPQLRPLKVVEIEMHDHTKYKAWVRAMHVDGGKHGGTGEPGSGIDPGNVAHEHPVGKYKLPATPLTVERYFQGHPLRECRHVKPPCPSLDVHTKRHIDEKPHEEWSRTLDAGPHWHERKVTDRDVDGYGKRIDIHPDALVLLKAARESGGRAFFVLEGALKADALLTAGEAVFDVPSVTLWRVPDAEMQKLVKLLQGVTVFIITDSDLESNPEVSLQAFVCRETLHEMGVEAYVAVPSPEPAYCKLHEAEAGAKRGIDDYLADGETVDDLQVIERQRSDGLRQWMETMRGHIRRNDRHSTVTTVLGWMSLLADGQGRVKKRLKALASVSGYSRRTVFSAVEQLVEMDPDDDLAPFTAVAGVSREGKRIAYPAIRRRGHSMDGRWYVGSPRDLDYDRVPLFTIRPDLRHVDREPRRTVEQVAPR